MYNVYCKIAVYTYKVMPFNKMKYCCAKVFCHHSFIPPCHLTSLTKRHASSSLFSRLHFSSRISFPLCRDRDKSSSLLAFNSSFNQEVWPCSSSFSCSIRFSLYCKGKTKQLKLETCYKGNMLTLIGGYSSLQSHFIQIL